MNTKNGIHFSNIAQQIISTKASRISVAIKLGSVPRRESSESFRVGRIALPKQLTPLLIKNSNQDVGSEMGITCTAAHAGKLHLTSRRAESTE